MGLASPKGARCETAKRPDFSAAQSKGLDFVNIQRRMYRQHFYNFETIVILMSFYCRYEDYILSLLLNSRLLLKKILLD